jgi:hypothetical protein
LLLALTVGAVATSAQAADPARTWRVVTRTSDSLILVDPASGGHDGGYSQATLVVLLRDPAAGPDEAASPYLIVRFEADCAARRRHQLVFEYAGEDLSVRSRDAEPGPWLPSDPGSNGDYLMTGVCDLAAGRPAEMISGTLAELRADYMRDYNN